MTDEDIDLCYQYLSEYLGLIDPIPTTKPGISFKNELPVASDENAGSTKIKILEVKNFENVNALSEDCSIKFGPNLTLVYGGNGSGKSGVGRLLCNACFSRGEREILPNVKTGLTPGQKPKATFIMDDSIGLPRQVDYSLGDSITDLKCFSVFDSKSVLIHLDQSNSVNFTPARIKIFDKVAATILNLEGKLTNERNKRKKDNPFLGMFGDDADSDTAIFCKGITGTTKESDFLKHANFAVESDGAKIIELEKQIDQKNKLDIPQRKLQLSADRQNLGVLKETLQNIVNRFTNEKINEANTLIRDIIEKKQIVESLSVQSFDDGVLKTIGCTEWKALIIAAKSLHEKEKVANDNTELKHCMLCHQELKDKEKSLFQNYWQFLESKAETELSDLAGKQTTLLQDFQSTKLTYPKFLATDPGVKTLNESDSGYLAELKVQFTELSDLLDVWMLKIGKTLEVSCDEKPKIQLEKIDALVEAKAKEETDLCDPAEEIAKMTVTVTSLKHKKEVTKVKDAALAYISFLKWASKANGVNFPGIKTATTRKRTESFLVGVLQNYKGKFNQELMNLDCDYNLIMTTSGEQGTTVKEYCLDFAEDYSPSQILSEGEQNACSIADFLTEAQLDKNNNGIIFDDPVTSLDHKRKDKVAKRLVLEALQRQVVVLTHDIEFVSLLVKHTSKNQIPAVAHWMRKVNGIPGCVEENTSPKLANLASLKQDSQESIRMLESLGAKEQEHALGVALDYLRSACEALIEEGLFNDTIQRYDDQIRVQNLEEAIFDQSLALRIVDLHGRMSEVLLAHNRSDRRREDPLELSDLTAFRLEFDMLEEELKKTQRIARKEREGRRKGKRAEQFGWN